MRKSCGEDWCLLALWVTALQMSRSAFGKQPQEIPKLLISDVWVGASVAEAWWNLSCFPAPMKALNSPLGLCEQNISLLD